MRPAVPLGFNWDWNTLLCSRCVNAWAADAAADATAAAAAAHLCRAGRSPPRRRPPGWVAAGRRCRCPRQQFGPGAPHPSCFCTQTTHPADSRFNTPVRGVCACRGPHSMPPIQHASGSPAPSGPLPTHLELSMSSTPSRDLLFEIWKRRSMTRSATSYRHTYLRAAGKGGVGGEGQHASRSHACSRASSGWQSAWVGFCAQQALPAAAAAAAASCRSLAAAAGQQEGSVCREGKRGEAAPTAGVVSGAAVGAQAAARDVAPPRDGALQE